MPTTLLDGRTAIVTGASKGIGRAIAIGLAQHGAHVVAGFKNDEQGADDTCRVVREEGGSAVAVGADVSAPGGSDRLVAAAVDAYGRLDVLVNNAGRTRFGPAADATVDDWDDVMGTNLLGPFLATRSAVEAMGPGGGAVINVSSCAATLMVPFHAVYTTSKGGLEAMTRQLALEYAPRVRVNAIAPGPTSMERNWEYDQDFDARWAELTPMRRISTPQDYVGPVAFLASDLSALVTGELLHVDGGWTIAGNSPGMSRYDFAQERRRG